MKGRSISSRGSVARCHKKGSHRLTIGINVVILQDDLNYVGILSTTTLGVRRLLHSAPGNPPFGTYETLGFHKSQTEDRQVTLENADGKFQSKLVLAENARGAARLRKKEYRGQVCCTKPEAEQAAARVFWDDSFVIKGESCKARAFKEGLQRRVQSAKRCMVMALAWHTLETIENGRKGVYQGTVSPGASLHFCTWPPVPCGTGAGCTR